MTRKFVLLIMLVVLPLAGCKKSVPFLSKAKEEESAKAAGQAAAATPKPAEAAVAAKDPAPKSEKSEKSEKVEAVAPKIDPAKASVVVLCYHRFEDKPKDSLAIKPAEFEQQMESIKEHGFTVIGMQDFLAWRRGEKDIPEKSCVISIDDGYRSAYTVAWPILKKHGYPFTMFIYTDYIKGQPKAGGQSMSWAELGEMRDAGVDIQSHTVSHTDLRSKKGRTVEAYEQWVRDELVNSRKLIEKELGISVKCLAYPYGIHSAEVRRISMEAGYEASFTVYGQRLTFHSPADQLGRYAIEGGKPKIFDGAMKMIGGGGGGADESSVYQQSSALMVTQPMEGETISDPSPTLKANLSTWGQVDPGSVAVRLSGIGLLLVKYDPATGMMEAKLPGKLKDPTYTAILSAKVKGRTMEKRWNFNYSATGAPAPEAPLPPRATPKGKK